MTSLFLSHQLLPPCTGVSEVSQLENECQSSRKGKRELRDTHICILLVELPKPASHLGTFASRHVLRHLANGAIDRACGGFQIRARRTMHHLRLNPIRRMTLVAKAVGLERHRQDATQAGAEGCSAPRPAGSAIYKVGTGRLKEVGHWVFDLNLLHATQDCSRAAVAVNITLLELPCHFSKCLKYRQPWKIKSETGLIVTQTFAIGTFLSLPFRSSIGLTASGQVEKTSKMFRRSPLLGAAVVYGASRAGAKRGMQREAERQQAMEWEAQQQAAARDARDARRRDDERRRAEELEREKEKVRREVEQEEREKALARAERYQAQQMHQQTLHPPPYQHGPQGQQAGPAAEVLFCAQCGNRCKMGDKFCSGCGNQLPPPVQKQ